MDTTPTPVELGGTLVSQDRCQTCPGYARLPTHTVYVHCTGGQVVSFVVCVTCQVHLKTSPEFHGTDYWAIPSSHRNAYPYMRDMMMRLVRDKYAQVVSDQPRSLVFQSSLWMCERYTFQTCHQIKRLNWDDRCSVRGCGSAPVCVVCTPGQVCNVQSDHAYWEMVDRPFCLDHGMYAMTTLEFVGLFDRVWYEGD